MSLLLDLLRQPAGLGTWGGQLQMLLRITLIAAAGLAVLALRPRAAAALRHRIAVVTLAAVLALPLATLLLPALPLAWLPPAGAAPPTLIALRADAPENGVLAARATVPPAPAVTTSAARPAFVRPASPIARRFPWGTLAAALLLACLAVSLGLTARLLASMLAAARVARAAVPIDDPAVVAEAEHVRRRLGIRRPVALRRTEALAVPAVFGVRHPVLLLPPATLAGPAERLSAVLLHELAHVARHDGLALLLTRGCRALLWFHPLVGRLAREAGLACEQACDDVVLSAGARPSDYAEWLLAIAQSARGADALRGVAPAFARRSTLERRIAAILEPGASRRPATRIATAAIGLAALTLLVPLASARVIAAPSCSSGSECATATTRKAAERRACTEARARAETRACTEARERTETRERATIRTATAEAFEEPHIEPNGRGVDAVPAVGPAPVTPAVPLQPAGARSGADWYDAARAHYNAGRFAAAATAYLNAAAAGQHIATSYYNAACSFARSGQRAAALDALGKALDAGFDEPELIHSDEDLDTLRDTPGFGRLLTRAMNTDAAEAKRNHAVAQFDALRSSASSDADQWHSSGIELLRLSEYGRSAAAFAAQFKIDSSAAALYNLACAWSLAGQRARGLDLLELSIRSGYGDPGKISGDHDLEALHDDPRFDALVALASDLELSGSMRGLPAWGTWRAELPRYERVAREHPDLGRAWWNLGFARLRAGDWDGSADAYGRALASGYRISTSTYNLACAHAQARRIDEALRCLQLAEARGMDVGGIAPDDRDLAPLRGDPRFQRMCAQWRRELASEREKEKREEQDRKHAK